MNIKESGKELSTIVLASIILAVAFASRAYLEGGKNTSLFYAAIISFFIIILANILTKKIVGYNLETNVKTKFWEWYQYGFRKDSHFKKPIPMAWLPLLVALFTRGFFLWLSVLEFDVEAKTERVSRRHGLYRFTQVTEWHMAWIATWALIVNLILAVAGYVAGYELFTKLSIYYIAWSTIPIGKLDGAKIFFGSKALWTVIFTVAMILLGWSLIVI